MKIRFSLQKKIMILGLGILLAADAVLAFYALESTNRSSRTDLAAQKAQMKLLKADIRRALAIQQSIPQTKADCERFENSLYASSAGYSAVTDELTEVAKRAGLQVASVGFHPKELPSRNMVELELDATVNGDYKAVVRFLNGLQRSKSPYIIDTLTLASEPTAGQAVSGALRVVLHLKSYFKNAA